MPHLLIPTINATLNLTSSILLFCGWRAIKAKKQQLHRKLMTSAMISSTLFLFFYVLNRVLAGGFTRYQGQGAIRILYFLILGTHTPLAMIIVPASLLALRHALRGDFVKHTRITKWLYPVWMYVSVTGVVIYFMLYIF